MIKFVIPFAFLSTSIFGQNLVINPSFEDTADYSLQQKRMLINNNYTGDVLNAKGWFTEGNETILTIDSDTSHLYSFDKYDQLKNLHAARTGFKSVYLILMSWSGAQEHLVGTLLQPLERGKKYLVKYYVQPDKIRTGHFVNNLGVKFSKTPHYSLPCDLPGVGNLDKNGNMTLCETNDYRSLDSSLVSDIPTGSQFITNDSTWTEISGYYIARGGEKYIALGYFYNKLKDVDKIINDYNYRYPDYRSTPKQLKHLKDKVLEYVNKHQDFLQTNNEILLPTELHLPDLFAVALYYVDDVSVEAAKQW